MTKSLPHPITLSLCQRALTSDQIRALPWLEAERPDAFCVRLPGEEKPYLQRSEEDPDAPLDPDMAHVWVRRDPAGKDLRDWKLAARLGFAERWGTRSVEKSSNDDEHTYCKTDG